MAEKKLIPCRVCGKLFKPCSYCQSHSDIFRWRNFACSYACASKYIADTVAYRESQYKKEVSISEFQPQESDNAHKEQEDIKKDAGKKISKKKSYETVNPSITVLEDSINRSK